MKRVLIIYKEKIALKEVENNAFFLQIKRRGDSTYRSKDWYTVRQQVSPRPGREHLHLSPCRLKITSFRSGFKANASNILL